MPLETCLALELLCAASILLVILFTNSIFLYKQKITDRISMMLLFAVVMSLSEIAWGLCDGKTALSALTYLAVFSYSIGFMLFASFLNHYLLERFGIRFN